MDPQYSYCWHMPVTLSALSKITKITVGNGGYAKRALWLYTCLVKTEIPFL